MSGAKQMVMIHLGIKMKTFMQSMQKDLLTVPKNKEEEKQLLK